MAKSIVLKQSHNHPSASPDQHFSALFAGATLFSKVQSHFPKYTLWIGVLGLLDGDRPVVECVGSSGAEGEVLTVVGSYLCMLA